MAGTKSDANWIAEALFEARRASDLGEVPVGAIVVKNGELVARGHNRRELYSQILGHAEIVALERAARTIGSWRLDGCTLYVTLEPCAMCLGAAENSRIQRLVFGTGQQIRSIDRSSNSEEQGYTAIAKLDHESLEHECSSVLQEFFEGARKRG